MKKSRKPTVISQIYSTKDYDLFAHDPENRIPRKNAALMASLDEYGSLSCLPVVVVSNGEGKYIIKDGENRFDNCRAKGQPIHFVFADRADVDWSKTNQAQHAWNLQNYVDRFIGQGRKDYIRLASLAKDFGLKLSTTAMLLAGADDYHPATKEIKDGTFRIHDEENAWKVQLLVKEAWKNVHWANNRQFVSALALTVKHGKCDLARLGHKLAACPNLLVHYTRTRDFVAMLDKLYNHMNRGELVDIEANIRRALKAARKVL